MRGGFCKSYLAPVNARMRTYLREVSNGMRKCAFLIAKGDINYCYATQRMFANSNRSSYVVNQSQLIVPQCLSFVIFKII